MAVPRQKAGAAPEVLARKVYYPGDVIFEEGAVAHCAYFVENGRVAVSKKARGGELILGTMGQGSIMGEMALIDDAPRMATVRAVEQTTLMQIDRTRLAEKIDEADPFIRKLLKMLVRNIRSVSDQQVAIVEKSSRTEEE